MTSGLTLRYPASNPIVLSKSVQKKPLLLPVDRRMWYYDPMESSSALANFASRSSIDPLEISVVTRESNHMNYPERLFRSFLILKDTSTGLGSGNLISIPSSVTLGFITSNSFYGSRRTY